MVLHATLIGEYFDIGDMPYRYTKYAIFDIDRIER